MNELINPGNTPQVYTKDGKTIPAGNRLEVDKLDTVGKAAVSAGRLVYEESDKDDQPESEAPPEEAKPQTSGNSDADSTTATARRSRGPRS